MTLRRIIIAVIFLIGFTSFHSCKTTKKKGEVSKVGKFYKNTTAYYNGYFNANEIYQNALVVLDDIHKDNYNQILPLYTYRDVPDTKSVSQDLDKVIEKLGRVINLHRVADWVDDSYLLMGKAQYVKQDFEKAQNVFEYFVDEMNPAFKKNDYKIKKEKKSKKKITKKKRKKRSKKKKKKKRRTRKQKEEDDKKAAEKKAKEEAKGKEKKSGIVKSTTFHRKGTKKDWETYNEGLLWMAKTYIEREKWASAYYLLTRLKTEYQNKSLKKEYPKVRAYYYLKQKQYEEAISPLEDALKYASKKKEKARIAYILGQVYEKLNNSQQAFAMFEKVGELHPDYDLEFNAKLKVLKNNSGNSEDYVQKEIKKLLKEEKYDDYKDNIYYTLAEINMKNNNVSEAIQNYNKSIAHNKNNPPLKAEVYYRLASINFEKQEYIASKNYYDSTLMVINKNDERYKEIKGLAENLKDIAKNLETIQLQDSLIRISKLSKEEQMKLAIDIKKKQLEQKKKEKERNSGINKRKGAFAESSMASADMLGGFGGKKDKVKSSFFIYNKSSIETGKKEFRSKWGSILLEDNWRRSNKSDSGFEDDSDSGDDSEITLTDLEMNNLLRGVPRTPDQLKMANSRIISAMLNLGILFRDKLGNYEKSADILEQLLNRYSDFDDKCKSMYYLQFSYKDLGQYDKAQTIVTKMSNAFPDCTYTKVLTDPDFINSKKNIVNAKERYYTEIFDLYKNGSYEQALAKINNADKSFKDDSKYSIKLDYLTAKITGKTEGKDKYILALEQFIKKYPKSKEAIHARETLRFIKGDKDTFNKLIYEEDLEKFTYQKDKLHYILVVVHDINDDDLKIIKTSISNYNKKFYKLDRLRMSNIYFDTKGKDQVILLRKFDSANAAMKYYNDVSKLSGDYISSKYNYEIYAISQKNYREVIKERTVNNYKEFFNKNYLQPEKK